MAKRTLTDNPFRQAHEAERKDGRAVDSRNPYATPAQLARRRATLDAEAKAIPNPMQSAAHEERTFRERTSIDALSAPAPVAAPTDDAAKAAAAARATTLDALTRANPMAAAHFAERTPARAPGGA